MRAPPQALVEQRSTSGMSRDFHSRQAGSIPARCVGDGDAGTRGRPLDPASKRSLVRFQLPERFVCASPKFVKSCSKCGEKKPTTQFPARSEKGREGERHSHCIECARWYVRQHYQRNRQKWIQKSMAQHAALKVKLDLIKSKPCADCGKQYPPHAMDFDHLPGTVKFGNIGTLVSRVGAGRVMEEVAKCEVVCAVCHRIRTHRRLSAGATPDDHHPLRS